MSGELDDKTLRASADLLSRSVETLGEVILGQREAVETAFLGFVWGGHVLVEALPGTGKTLFCRALAAVSGLSFRRVQCTPDLLPADITGTDVLGADGKVVFREGPVFANVLLVDEINRASPRTQAALLEAMQEKAVTWGGRRMELPDPFFVAATQNPVEMEGTYPLPEAELDRFAYRVVFGPSSLEELVGVIDLTLCSDEPVIPSLFSRDELLALREAAFRVVVPSPVKEFAARLIVALDPARSSLERVRRHVRFGVSVRAAQAMLRGAMVKALSEGRPACGFEDVLRFAPAALGHRVVLGMEALSSGMEPGDLVREVLETVEPAGEP